MSRLNQRGLTLVELLVATSVISILTILMMNFVANRIVDNAVKNARSDIELQTQATLDTISRDIKHSANVDDQNRWEDPYAPGSPADNFSWISDADTLVMATPSQDQSGNILWQDHQAYLSYKDNAIYFVNGGTLYRRTLAAPVSNNRETTTCPATASGCPHDGSLVNNVTNFSLSYYDQNDQPVAAADARSVSITLRVDRRVFTKDLNAEYTVRTVFRNE